MAQRGERAVRVHPLAEVSEDLLARPRPMQRFELRPLLGLRLLYEVENNGREDGARAIVSITRDRDVAVSDKVVLDNSLEGSLGVPRNAHAVLRASRWSNHQMATCA